MEVQGTGSPVPWARHGTTYRPQVLLQEGELWGHCGWKRDGMEEEGVREREERVLQF